MASFRFGQVRQAGITGLESRKKNTWLGPSPPKPPSSPPHSCLPPTCPDLSPIHSKSPTAKVPVVASGRFSGAIIASLQRVSGILPVERRKNIGAEAPRATHPQSNWLSSPSASSARAPPTDPACRAQSPAPTMLHQLTCC
ncbi:uncharacterized protein MKK02DRAFT_30187 [Dioszegia hungarica]|uniref:Uncharacterized protein n=1 Tax=Dioszegia hungarica TaxID=4972 RepID=A0AA38H499_9TREE|nr:uncharacterized protein MKK02DRAFT_30187 [Dioszegia hungarica]KAI9632351.1 hypothetical protein MKK02DRAFT_30187 [Dioszegia hungarica]